MKLRISGQHVDVGESLTTHINDSINNITKGLFDNPIDGHVTFAKQRHLFLVEITLHPMAGVILQGHASADEPYIAFDLAAEKIKKQLTRYKARLKDHKLHKGVKANGGVPAQQYILQHDPFSDEADDHDEKPIIVAEMASQVDTMTVGEAVMHMDLRDAATLVFKNKKNGGLNIVYRRPDGNIGWIDPTNMA